MILSHKYKFIFLKTAKTAGTSIEISLSRFCGGNDVITPISFKDEKFRKELGLCPQNYLKKYSEYNPKDILRLLIKRRKAFKFRNHTPAKEAKKKIDPEIWESYFKFCFVRNPWDRAISDYYWPKSKGDLNDFLRKSDLAWNSRSYTIEGEVVLDYIGKYENLMEDLCVICKKLDIPFDKWLPRAKGKSRKDRRHYSEVLNHSQANLIGEKCEKEIKLFGYEF